MLSNNELNIIIQGCINLDRISQKDFYKKYYGYLAAVCTRYNQDIEIVNEMVNDSFLKIFSALKNFKNESFNLEMQLKAWMKSITINTCVDYFRKNTKSINIINNISENEMEHLEYTSETPIDKLSYYEILEFTQQLTPAYKLIFNMYVVDGVPYEEISKVLNISLGTCKSNMFKARQQLIKLIEKKYKKVI